MGDMLTAEPELICLADLAADYTAVPTENIAATDSFAPAKLEEQDMDAVFRELYEAMDESGQEQCELCTSIDLGGLVDKTKMFLDKMEDILERAGVNLPVRALFVLFSDLLKADNLDNLGTVQIARD